jgi:hypothetical protein
LPKKRTKNQPRNSCLEDVVSSISAQ